MKADLCQSGFLIAVERASFLAFSLYRGVAMWMEKGMASAAKPPIFGGK
jgi:hypothetical protein